MKYLFRGFHECENGTKTIIVDGLQDKGEWVYWDEFGRLTETLNLGTIVFYKDCEISKVPIIPETVGQWTGLTDKNGVNVFEYSIVKDIKGNIGYVKYLIQEAGFNIVLKKYDYKLGHRNTGAPYGSEDIEVIGNLWENHELVEVE